MIHLGFTRTIFAGAMAVAMLTVPQAGAQPSPDDTAQIAKEAFIYAYPMLYGYKTLQEQTQDQFAPGYIGGFGRFRHYSETYTPDDKDIVTPNNDTPYSWAWLDLRAEPWVLTVPDVPEDRYNVLQWFDLYTFNFAYVGVRATGHARGSYLFAGPHWEGETPAGINQVFHSETDIIGTLTRTGSNGPDDAPNVRALQQQYVLQPLSEFAGGRPPAPAPLIHWPSWNEERALSADFISYLNFLLQFTEPDPSETELLARFATIGIGAGLTFDRTKVPAETLAAIEAGAAAGLQELEAEVTKVPGSSGLFGSRAFMKNDYKKRALGAMIGIYGNSIEEAYYSSFAVDAAGALLDGENAYKLRFPSGGLPPVDLFWSMTMYGLPDRQLVANEIKRYSIGDRTAGLVTAEDGSLTLYIQHDRPEGDEAANWLPAPAGPFFMVGRFYGPQSGLIDGSYAIPKVERLQ